MQTSRKRGRPPALIITAVINLELGFLFSFFYRQLFPWQSDVNELPVGDKSYYSLTNVQNDILGIVDI